MGPSAASASPDPPLTAGSPEPAGSACDACDGPAQYMHLAPAGQRRATGTGGVRPYAGDVPGRLGRAFGHAGPELFSQLQRGARRRYCAGAVNGGPQYPAGLPADVYDPNTPCPPRADPTVR